MIAQVEGPLIIVNPARAGMILGTLPTHTGQSRKPRASGDDPVECHVYFCQAPVNPARAGMIP